MIDIYLGTTTSKTYLHGLNVVAPIKSTQFIPTAGHADTIEEVLEIILAGAGIFACLQSLEQLITVAKMWQGFRYGAPVYLGCRVVATEGYYRSEVLDGWIEPGGGAASGPAQRGKESLIVRLHVRRPNYWESETLVALTLVNQQTPGGISTGIQIYNHGDAGHDNFVTIDDALISGGLPARCMIDLYSDINDARFIRNVYMGLTALASSGHALISLVLEGEDGTGGADIADANSSGGKYRALTWAGTTEALLEYWVLSSNILNYLRGGLVKMVARLQAVHAYTDLYFKWKIEFALTSTILWESDWVNVAANEFLQVLPGVRLPPFPQSFDDVPYGLLRLKLYARRDASDTNFWRLDFIQMFVTEGYREWTSICGAKYAWVLDDNGFMGTLTTHAAAGAGELVTHQGAGSQLLLMPGVNNKIVFLWDQDDLTAPIARTAVVTITYAPRVRSI